MFTKDENILKAHKNNDGGQICVDTVLWFIPPWSKVDQSVTQIHSGNKELFWFGPDLTQPSSNFWLERERGLWSGELYRLTTLKRLAADGLKNPSGSFFYPQERRLSWRQITVWSFFIWAVLLTIAGRSCSGLAWNFWPPRFRLCIRSNRARVVSPRPSPDIFPELARLQEGVKRALLIPATALTQWLRFISSSNSKQKGDPANEMHGQRSRTQWSPPE